MNVTVTDQARTDARALRMLRSGWAPKDVALETSIGLDELRQLQRDFPSIREGQCRHDACGHPQAGSGRPRRGWLQIKPASETALWFCGWACAERHVLAQLRKAMA